MVFIKVFFVYEVFCFKMEEVEICFVFLGDYDVVVEFFCVIYENKGDEDYDFIFIRFNGWFMEFKRVVFVV